MRTLLGSSFLNIISASLTPAILILATGSLVTSTLSRIARIVDRARILIERVESQCAAGDAEGAAQDRAWLAMYARRGALAERALTLYYTAIGLFVAACLAIMIDSLTNDIVPWLSLVLVVLGSIFLFIGTAALVIETNLATGILHAEIDRITHLKPKETSNARIE